MIEYLYTYRMCCDNEFIWIIDAVTRGLFRMNKRNYFVESILSPMEIYEGNVFDIQVLQIWGDQIIMIPVEISKEWIIFYRETRKIERFKPVNKHLRCVDAVLMENKIICIPARADEPFVVVDLQVRKYTDYITSRLQKVNLSDLRGEIWNSISDNNIIYFPIRKTYFIGLIDNYSMNIVKLNLDSVIIAGDFYEGNWWIVTQNRSALYCFDEFGNLFNKFSTDVTFDCIRLVATKRYIFMLPENESYIHIFDKKLKAFKKVNLEIYSLPKLLYTLTYWYYYYDDQYIIFLPHSYPCTVINLNTLKVEHKDMIYSKEFIEKYYWKYYKDMRVTKKHKYFYENTMTYLQSFIRFVENNKAIEYIEKCEDAK